MTLPSSPAHGLYYHPDSNTTTTTSHHVSNNNAEWLASLVNERHVRNWKKIERFVESMKGLEGGSMTSVDDHEDDDDEEEEVSIGKASGRTIPRSYDGK